jgi:hypothetical protein
LFFLRGGEFFFREKYAFGVFQLDPVGFEWIFIEPVILDRVVDDLPEIPDVFLCTVVIALADSF